MPDFQLRPLDPTIDHDLYVEAFHWRKAKRHLSASQMPLEKFLADDPTHLTVGLFNPDLIAVFFFREYQPAKFEAHFTSKKGVPRETLLQSVTVLLTTILTYADEVSALVLPTNRPLRQFVTDLGMKRVGTMQFCSCVELTQGDTLPSTRNHRERFIRYVKFRDTPLGP